jgi:HEPN domain-containing protein
VNRTELQRLSLERLDDARTLLDNGRWSGAYYLSGYALECAIKSCVLKNLEETGFIYKDRDNLKALEKKYWIHDLNGLVAVAGLTPVFGVACGADPLLQVYWATASLWNELCRYESRDETQARNLIEAIDNMPNGALQWFRARW